MFHYLHGHSHFSLLRSIGSPKQYITQAQIYGLQTLALTDYDSMYGVIEFYQGCTKAGIKPIIGVQLVLVGDLSKSSDQQFAFQLSFLALNQTGYHQLMKLVSDAHTIGFFEGPRIDMSMIQSYITDCIITIGGPRSCFKVSHSPEGVATVTSICQKLQHIVGADRVMIEHIIQDYTLEPEVQLINEFATGIAHQLAIPMVCNPDYHYVHESDKEIYEIALCIRDGQTLFDRQRKKIVGHYYLMSPDQIASIMRSQGLSKAEIDSLWASNQSVADRCQIHIDLGSLHFPQYESSPQIQDLYSQYQSSH